MLYSKDLRTEYEPDVLVVGGGPAGLCAAVAAARSGARTMLVEKNGFCGGSTLFSSSVVWVPCNDVMTAEGVEDSREEALTPVPEDEAPSDASEAEPERGGAPRRATPGSVAFVPPVMGMILGGEVVKDIALNRLHCPLVAEGRCPPPAICPEGACEHG